MNEKPTTKRDPPKQKVLAVRMVFDPHAQGSCPQRRMGGAIDQEIAAG